MIRAGKCFYVSCKAVLFHNVFPIFNGASSWLVFWMSLLFIVRPITCWWDAICACMALPDFSSRQPVGTCSTQMRKRAFLSSIGISFARASVYLLVLYSSSSRLFTRTQMDGTLFIAIQKWWFVNSWSLWLFNRYQLSCRYNFYVKILNNAMTNTKVVIKEE